MLTGVAHGFFPEANPWHFSPRVECFMMKNRQTPKRLRVQGSSKPNLISIHPTLLPYPSKPYKCLVETEHPNNGDWPYIVNTSLALPEGLWEFLEACASTGATVVWVKVEVPGNYCEPNENTKCFVHLLARGDCVHGYGKGFHQLVSSLNLQCTLSRCAVSLLIKV